MVRSDRKVPSQIVPPVSNPEVWVGRVAKIEKNSAPRTTNAHELTYELLDGCVIGNIH